MSTQETDFTRTKLPPSESRDGIGERPLPDIDRHNDVVESAKNIFEASYLANSQGDVENGLALGRAAAFLNDNPDNPNAYGFAQRRMEEVLKAGEWADGTRRVAVAMNTEQRVKDGRPPMTLGDAITEMKAYAQDWSKATLHGGKDEWLNQEGISLGYWTSAAARGEAEGLDYLLMTVEGLIHHSGALSEQERGADELRDLRDALFNEKERLEAEAQQQPERHAARAHQERDIANAREGVAQIISGDAPGDSASVDTKFAVRQAEFDALPEEEKTFRLALATVKSAMHISTTAEMGLGREKFNALSGPQKSRLTQLFQDARRERMQTTGEEAVNNLRERLMAGIKQIVGETSNKVVTTHMSPESHVPVMLPAIESDPSLQPAAAVETSTSSRVTELPGSRAESGNGEQSVKAMGINFANAYLRNPAIKLWIEQQGVDLKELSHRMGSGAFNVTSETKRRMQRLVGEVRPDSSVWGTAPGANSILGRAADGARHELLEIVRSF